MKGTKSPHEANDWKEISFHPRAYESTHANAGALMFCTFTNPPCGCKVTGNGTLQHPLTVTFCPLHTAAPDLLKALQSVINEVNETDSDMFSDEFEGFDFAGADETITKATGGAL